MRVFPSGLVTSIGQDVTSLARVVTITPRLGSVIRITDFQTDLVIGADTFIAAAGVSSSAIASKADGSSANVIITIALSETSVVTRSDILRGVYDHAAVEIGLVDHLNTAAGIGPLFAGKVGEIRVTDRGFAEIEARSLSSASRALVVEKYQPSCRADLGDARCKVDLGPLTFAGSVTAVVSAFVIEIDVPGAPDGADDYYNLGGLTWTTGANTGAIVQVRDWVASTRQATIMMPAIGLVSIGDEFTIFRGCDKQPSTCANVFDNILNFRGEPHVPVSTDLGGQ